MSDDEREYSEEEEEEEEEEGEQEDGGQQKSKDKKKPSKPTEATPAKSEAELILEEKIHKKKSEEEDQWREYIEQWRKQRAKEEEELRVLKEKQGKRKAQRESEEKKMNEYKRQQEEARQKEAEEKKRREMEEKKRRLEEAEKKRQAMLNAMEEQKQQAKPNFVVQKRTDAGPGASLGNTAMDKMMNVAAARGELGKTKEQLMEDKRISLSFRIKPLEIEGLPVEKLKETAKELWEQVHKLETEKYDLEQRQKRQDYDLKELGERQRQMNRNKALKKGLDPEALTGKHPPKIQVASKFERRIDRRSYGDKKGLFDGGFEAQGMAVIEKLWSERLQAFEEKKGALPKWIGEAQGKKEGGEPVPEEE